MPAVFSKEVILCEPVSRDLDFSVPVLSFRLKNMKITLILYSLMKLSTNLLNYGRKMISVLFVQLNSNKASIIFLKPLLVRGA